jgi:hypothetical protein
MIKKLLFLLLFLNSFFGISQNHQLQFTASENDRVTIPANAVYELGAQSFTVEAVINADQMQSSNFPMIVSKRGTDEFSGFFLALDQVGTEYYLFTQIDGLNLFVDQSLGIVLNDGQCHHVAVRRDGNQITIFIDGVSVASVNTSPTRQINNNADIIIGSDEPTNNPFEGIILEVRFWNTARSDQEILDTATSVLTDTNATGLTGYWRLNETGTIQAITDVSATANNGVIGATNLVESEDPQRVTAVCTDFLLSVTDDNSNHLQITVYPNPFTNQVVLQSTSLLKEYTIFSMAGKRIIEGTIDPNQTIVFSDSISSGIYLLTVKDENGREQIIKLVKL